MKNVAGKLSNIALVIFITVSSLSFLGIFLTRGDTSLIGYKGFIVLTGSMYPVFDAGSYIVVKEKKAEDIEKGDIITYRVGTDTVLTHRVVEILRESEEYLFVTKGDANNVPDKNPVKQSQLIGETVFWINGLGTLFAVLRQPPTLVLLAFILCAMGLVYLIGKKVLLGKG